MKSIRVKEIMTTEPCMVQSTRTVKEAAALMKSKNCGILPVGKSDNIIGMLTDRDITIRVVAEGKDPSKTLVGEVMTNSVFFCDEEDDIEDAADIMRDHDVARLVVTDGRKATGIVNMTCLLRAGGHRRKGDKVLHELVKPVHGKKKAAAPVDMATAGGGCESCESY